MYFSMLDMKTETALVHFATNFQRLQQQTPFSFFLVELESESFKISVIERFEITINTRRQPSC